MPRSLYRWKTFWFGLFIILSLAWAWADSYRYFAAINWVGKGLVWSGDGEVGCGLVQDTAPFPFEIQTIHYPLSEVGMSSVRQGFKNITIPHWLFFESFLILWFLLLGWRTRRHWRKSQDPTNLSAP